MIKKLQRIIVESGEDGTQVSKLPSNEQMMLKINEIIEYVNKHEKSVEDHRLKELFKPRKMN